jgi:ribonucleotide monophosphatase NagD (HAD superfamily)
LYKAGKGLIILSNSSSLALKTVTKLPRLGFRPEHFVGAVTSGQEAVAYLRVNHCSKKALLFTWKALQETPSPTAFLSACGDMPVTTNPAEAEIIVLHGPEVLRGPGPNFKAMLHGRDVLSGPGPDMKATEISLGNFHTEGDLSMITPILEQCLARNIPMVCVNPDHIVVKPDNTQRYMPGLIADLYEKMGGQVTSFGKPHRPHFEACIAQLQLPRERIVHVGDSLHHDVMGANKAGIASIFVAGGVHREELGSCELGTLPSEEALEKLFTKHGQTPTHVVPLFRM